MGLAPPFLFAELFGAKVRDFFKIVHSAVESFLYEFVICGPGPIFKPLNQSMFDRIIMNIIHMTLEVMFIAYLMFPEPALPNANFALTRA